MKQRYFSFVSALLIGASALLQAQTTRPFINVWEVAYGAGSPFGATEWRDVTSTRFTQKFTQMTQVSLLHQFSESDWGAATSGYRYPAIGGYVKWLDYSHLRMEGKGDKVPTDAHFDYGQIASFGWVLQQTTWDKGPWSGHIHLENGAAYVFDPVYEYQGDAVTLAKPWQIFIGIGYMFNYQMSPHAQLSLGTQFTHMSNSGLGTYNTGINTFSLSLRYRHTSFTEIQRCSPEKALLERNGSASKPHLYGSVMAGLGGVFYEHSERANGQLTLMADAMYRLAPSHGLGIGADYWHCSQPDRTGRTDYYGVGIKYDHWWGPFVIHVQGGSYLNGKKPIKWKGTSRFFEHIGCKFVFCRQNNLAPYLGLYTKGNGFNAEELCFAIGTIIQ